MALKIRISLYLTFNTKSSQKPRTFSWPFSQTFSLVYSPLNSTTLSCSSEVTLTRLFTQGIYRYSLFNKKETRLNEPDLNLYDKNGHAFHEGRPNCPNFFQILKIWAIVINIYQIPISKLQGNKISLEYMTSSSLIRIWDTCLFPTFFLERTFLTY